MAAAPETQTGPYTTAPPLDNHPSPIATRDRPSRQATASLILGIAGLPLLLVGIPGLVVPILAIILGGVARVDARRRGATQTRRATAGMILGAGAIALYVLAVIVVLVA